MRFGAVAVSMLMSSGFVAADSSSSVDEDEERDESDEDVGLSSESRTKKTEKFSSRIYKCLSFEVSRNKK